MPVARTRRYLLPTLALLIILGGGLAFVASARLSAPGGAAVKPGLPVGTGGVTATSGQNQPQTPHMSLAGLRWSDFYGVELPSSATAGPRDTSRGLAVGFAHSPLGALLAAVNIAVRANAQWGPRIFTAVIRGQVAGPGAAALLANCQTSYDQASLSEDATGGAPLGDVDVAEEAFRWVSYTSTEAIIDLVSAGPGGQGTTVRASTQIEVVWADGDWKVIAPPDGDWGNSATEVSSLRGYTVLPGQGGDR